MQVKETVMGFIKYRRRQILLTLLFLFPLVFLLFHISLPQQFVFLNTYIISGGYLIIPALLVQVVIFGIPFASPNNLPEWYLKISFIFALIATPIFWYIFASVVIGLWDRFNKNLNRKVQFYLVIILVILFSPFIYKELIRPAIVSCSFSIEMNVPSEISIGSDYREYYDNNGSFDKYILQEFVLRNGSMLDTVYEVPRQAPEMCLYNTTSGSIVGYNGYYADKKGHGFVDPPYWNKIILAPKSEINYYLLGDMTLSDKFNEILIPKNSYWPPNNKDCSVLTKEDIEAGIAGGAEIIKVSK